MGAVIFKGSTVTLRFSPTNGMQVGDLGTPYVGVSQSRTFLTPDALVDTSANTVSAKLTEEETLLLTAGSPARVQLAFKNETTGDTIRFPIHEVPVKDTIFAQLGQ